MGYPVACIYLLRKQQALGFPANVPRPGVVGFYEFQEYLIDDLLPHHQNLLDNIGFEGGVPHATA